MVRKLTKQFIDGLPHGSARGTWYADSKINGFFVVSYSTGQRVFFVRFRVAGARKVMKVGRYGAVTVDKARDRARELLSQAELGGNPSQDRAKARAMPTFGSWAKTYLERVQAQKKSPREDARFLPIASERWSTRPLDSITSDEVEVFRHEIVVKTVARWKAAQLKKAEKNPGAPILSPPATIGRTGANRWLASLRSCFAAAIRAGHIRINPASGLTKFREAPPRARVLSADELQRFLACLEKDPDVYARAAFRLLVETGARLSEVLRARWTDFDFESGTWRLPSPKSGRPQIVPLASYTAKMLRKLPRMGCFVIAGQTQDKPRYDLQGPWRRLVVAADLGDARIHDLRRTFGLAVAKEAGLHVASKLLRHSDIRVTEAVYAPLGLEDLRAAVERRGTVLPFTDMKKAETA